MPNLKFYKNPIEPKADVGSIWFDETNKVAKIKTETGWTTYNGPILTNGSGNKVLTDSGEYVDLKEYMINSLAYGVEWDESGGDPTKLTRIGNLELHKTLPIQSAFKGCVINSEGIPNYYLDANDWSKKENGSNSILDGTDGNVMVDIGNDFYMKFANEGAVYRVYCSLTQIDSSWIKVPRVAISAYRLTVDKATNKAYSCVNTTESFKGGNQNIVYDDITNIARDFFGKPRTSVSRENMRKYARNNNMELLCYEYYKYILYWLYVIEYANFNCQAPFNSELTVEGFHQGGLGPGITQISSWEKLNNYNPICKCGYTNDLGNGTGTKALIVPAITVDETEIAEQTTYPCRWRGIENPFGDIWTLLDGTYIYQAEKDGERKVYSTSNPDYFDETPNGKLYIGNETLTSGNVQTFIFGKFGDIIPKTTGNNIKFDYHYTDNNSDIKRIFLVGGGANSWSGAGLAFVYSDFGLSGAASNVGFRSCIVLSDIDSSELSWKLYE